MQKRTNQQNERANVNADGDLPRIRNHKGSGQAAVVIAGKWYYLGKWGTPDANEAYDRLIMRWLSGGRHLADEATADLTIAELIRDYWRFAERKYVDPDGRPRHELSAVRTALGPLRRLFGALPARDFGPLKLALAREQYVASGDSRTTVNDKVRRVRRMFRWAVSRELIPAAALQGLQAVEGLRAGESAAAEPRDVRPVPDANVEAVLARVSDQVAAMIRLQLLCGARPGEICIMRACDIDMSAATWVYRPARHKTEKFGKSREVFLGPKAQTIVRQFLTTDRERYLFSPADAAAAHRKRREEARVTPIRPSDIRRKLRRRAGTKRKPGDHYTTQSYRTAIWRACDEAFLPAPPLGPEAGEKKRAWRARLTAEQLLELEAWRESHRWNPNQLRHNFGTMIRREHGIETARVLLGHASVGTSEIYSERDAALAAKVISRVG